MGRIILCEGDLTQAAVDAVINAANEHLILGSGVAGAIRERGGPEIQAECDRIGPIEVGSAAMTKGGRLPAPWVIHAAGMSLSGRATEDSVRRAFQASLALATERGLHSVAVPALGAGVGGLSLQRSAEILLAEARAHLAGETSLTEIRFVLFGEQALRVFEHVNDAAAIAEQMKRLGR